MRLERITSRQNQRLIHARKVRDGKEPDLIFIEGRRLAAEAMSSNLKVVECFVIENFGDQTLLSTIDKLSVDVIELPDALFRSIAETQQPQGVILLAERPAAPFEIADWTTATVPIYVFLKEVNNPSNLGAILRSVEAAGAGGIFVSRNSADVYSPKSLRASMGSAFRIPVRVEADLSDIVSAAKDAGVKCYAVDGHADKSYLDVEWTKPCLLVFGSEAHGLDPSDVGLLSDAISIPMEASVESLNLAVAVGIIVFEARRQALRGSLVGV